MNQRPCSIVMFYEQLSDSSTTYAVIKLLPLLESLGFKSFCAEEPSDTKKINILNTYTNSVKFFKQVLKATLTSDHAVKQILNSGMISIARGSSQKEILKSVKQLARDFVASSESNLKLLTSLDEYDMSYCGIDIPSQVKQTLVASSADPMEQASIRNNHMKIQIEEACKKGNVFALAGVGRHPVSALLQAEGHTVKDYYITEQPISEAHESKFDYLLRCHTTECLDYRVQHFNNGKVIDLAQDYRLDPVELITQDLTAGNSNTFDTNAEELQ